MTTKPDGGPAFPRNGGTFDQPGMSLRDYLAAKAMQGWISDWIGPNTPKEIHILSFAENCYKMADAMLAERTK